MKKPELVILLSIAAHSLLGACSHTLQPPHDAAVAGSPVRESRSWSGAVIQRRSGEATPDERAAERALADRISALRRSHERDRRAGGVLLGSHQPVEHSTETLATLRRV